MDRFAIKTACQSVRSSRGAAYPNEIVRHPDYFGDPPPDAELEFHGRHRFRFASPLPTRAAENNIVAGQFRPAKRSGEGGGRGPAVLLLHGWNGEQGYRLLFPPLAWRFNQLGMTVGMIELPYHGSRKPGSGNLRNFMSGDILHMMEATRQAIADIRAMVGWMTAEGYGPIGLWGVSLGAWLGGLVACCDPRLQAVVLLTPVPNIDQAIETLPFCRHIRASIEGLGISAADLNLKAHRPRLEPRNILIVQSLYDLFAPAESVEELWEAWGKTEIWRVKHGHISVLFSVPVMNRSGLWLRRRLLPTPSGNPRGRQRSPQV